MYRRPLADVQKAFSRLFQQNVHSGAGTPLRTVRPLHRHDKQTIVDVTAPDRQRTLLPVPCLSRSSGHALRAVQPASESVCSFLFIQTFCTFLLYTFCTPSVHLLYTFCTPSAHSVHLWTLHKPYSPPPALQGAKGTNKGTINTTDDRGERVRLEQSCSSSSNLRRPRGRTRPCVGSCEVSLVTLLRG